MEIGVNIQASADTTANEVATLTAKLRQALEALPAVDRVVPVAENGPAGAKGAIAVLGKLFVEVAPGAVAGVFAAVKALASRPSSPPFSVEFSRDGAKATFDPRTGTVEQFAAFVGAVRPPSPASVSGQ